jgi:hypothetical protein
MDLIVSGGGITEPMSGLTVTGSLFISGVVAWTLIIRTLMIRRRPCAGIERARFA